MPRPARAELSTFATRLAARLPGLWTAAYHRHADRYDQYPIAEDLWDNAHASWAVNERFGRFVPVDRPHERYHRLPTGMEPAEQRRYASAAANTLSHHYGVALASELYVPGPTVTIDVPLGDTVAHLADRIRQADHSGEAADALTELTAPCNGVVTGISEVLTAAAEFWTDLGEGADYHHAQRLRHLAAELTRHTHELARLRGHLADRHTTHPHHTSCHGTAETEQERTTTCSCPPSPAFRHRPPPRLRPAGRPIAHRPSPRSRRRPPCCSLTERHRHP
ncbi:hypothetical protein [Actinacidiphila oryziradicis]|uniref:Uncharacterized protein n=1 Tax=Actinacidiphila oryziradicis TaxID=2571141 RepID=A0A4V5MZH8_9ACTN|nr:hypothetical protein [Actinacidiphila oryziradicis]TKA08229.1 hypothetical protein FCI23_29625 [Actinacidiphila oryziradicis]